MRDKPVIGITMGDAAGIGPEIIAKSLQDRSLGEQIRAVVIGDANVMRRTIAMLGANTGVVLFERNVKPGVGAIEVVDLGNLPMDFALGVVSPEAGKAAGEYIEKAVELSRSKEID